MIRNVVLCALCALSLAACGGDGQSSNGIAEGGSTTTAPETGPTAPPVDAAPTIEGVPPSSVVVGSPYTYAPTASDPDGNALTFGITNMPTWAAFDTLTGKLTGTATSADVGTFTNITISVSDGTTSASVGPFQIKVIAASGTAPANNPPVISGTPPTTVVAGQAYTFTPTASDADKDSLAFTIANKPTWAKFDTTTGKLSGTPSAANEKTYTKITISVSDGDSNASLPAFSIAVTAPTNRPPVISGTPATADTVGTKYSFTPTASDPDGNTLTFSMTGKPSWLTLNTATGQITGTPTAANVGSFANIVMSVSDGKASASLQSFNITVSAGGGGGGGGSTNTPPVISGSPQTTASVGTAYTFTPTASDANGNALTFAIQNKPTWATFSASTGALTGTPTSANIGTATNIVISVSDGTATVSLASFSIAVTSAVASGTATLKWTPPTQNSDGSALTNLAGYNVYYGTSSGNLNKTAQAAGAGTTSYTITALPTGTWYFALAAYTTAGAQSALSGVGSKTIQ